MKIAKAEFIDKVQRQKVQRKRRKELNVKEWATFHCSWVESNFDFMN
jgi:hypothetical protein